MSAPANGAPKPLAQVVPVQPVPFTAGVSTVRLENGKHVVTLTLHVPTGPVTVFMPPEGGEQIARDLNAYARRARSGLILPGQS